MQANFTLTADIGGSHITAGVCQLDNLRLLPETIVRVEVFSKGTAQDILHSWQNAFEKALAKNEGLTISGLSVAMPGPFDYTNGISYIKGLNKYDAIYGMNIKKYFAELLNIEPGMVRFRNDAESAIAGEVLMGAGKDYNKVLGITLGTGFGSAFSMHQKTGDLNLGSKPYKETIADDYLSTRWFVKRYAELGGIHLHGGVKELAGLAATSTVARNVFNEFAVNMCQFLSDTIDQLNPDALVLCGNIAKASPFFLPKINQLLHNLPVKLGILGDDAPLIGATDLFKNDGESPVLDFNTKNISDK